VGIGFPVEDNDLCTAGLILRQSFQRILKQSKKRSQQFPNIYGPKYLKRGKVYGHVKLKFIFVSFITDLKGIYYDLGNLKIN